jgi:hypothetical protein
MWEKQALNGGHVPLRDISVRVRNFKGKLLVASGPVAVELEDVGAVIFRGIDGESSINDISARVSKEYDVPAEVALADCIDFVGDLRDRGLVRIRDTEPANPGS